MLKLLFRIVGICHASHQTCHQADYPGTNCWIDVDVNSGLCFECRPGGLMAEGTLCMIGNGVFVPACNNGCLYTTTPAPTDGGYGYAISKGLLAVGSDNVEFANAVYCPQFVNGGGCTHGNIQVCFDNVVAMAGTAVF